MSAPPESLVGTDVLVTLLQRSSSGENHWEEHITEVTDEGIFVGNAEKIGWIPFVGSNVGIKEIRDTTGILRYDNPCLERYISSSRLDHSDAERARVRSHGRFYSV